MTTELSEATVKAAAGHRGGAHKSVTGVDSLRITRVRVLVNRMWLHQTGHTAPMDTTYIPGDSSRLDPGVSETGIFIMEFSPAGQLLFSNAEIPAGNYDALSFSMYGAQPGDLAQLTNPVYSDFITGDNATVIIDGFVSDTGRTDAFSYHSRTTPWLDLGFDQGTQISGSIEANFAVRCSPVAIFKRGNARPIDPRIEANRSAIDDGIRSSMTIHKR